MRPKISFTLLLSVLLCTTQLYNLPRATADPISVDIPALGHVTSTVLQNGLQVLTTPSTAADLVTIDVWAAAGTRRETKEDNGVAHFMEHLMFKGTLKRKAGDIDADVEDLGGTLNASTSYDWAHFYLTVSSEDSDAAMEILSDAIRNSQLRQEDMDSERPVILNEMARLESSPTEELTTVFNAMAFPCHPYGRPLLGSPEIVANVSRAEVLKFYHTYYVPSNIAVVLSGNISNADGVALVQKYFGDWTGPKAPPDDVHSETFPAGIHSATLPSDDPSAYVLVGFGAPSVKDQPDAYVMDVLLTLLGQGGNNLLQQHLVRRDKLATAITANYLTQKNNGTLTITATCGPGYVDQVREGILAEIRSLQDQPVSASELESAKHALLASYLFDAQTTSGRADALGFYNTIDSFIYDVDYIRNFEGVSAAQIQGVAKRYLNLGSYILVTKLPSPEPITASLPTHTRCESVMSLK